MEALGINPIYLIVQLCIVGLLLALPIAALLQLRKRYFSNETNRILWVIIIIFAPIIGAAAFFIVNPNEEPNR